MFLLGPIGCQVYVVRTSPRKLRVCAVLLSWFPSPSAHVYLFCQCASPRKHRVCAVLLSLVPFPFCTRLFVMAVCFASQTPGLCSASIFGSLPLLHTFICLFCQCTSPRKHRVCAVLLSWFPSPSAHVYLFCQCASPRKHRVCFVLPFCTRLCQCASPHKLRVCAVLFPPSLINLFAFMLCLYFTIDFVLRISPCKLRVCLGPKPKFLFGFVVF